MYFIPTSRGLKISKCGNVYVRSSYEGDSETENVLVLLLLLFLLLLD